MEFTVGPVQPSASNGDPLKVVPVAKSGDSKDRRKKKNDRRKNVRDGVYVSLSTKEDRRQPGDRRKSDG
jgi:hypothetical protein